MRDFVFVHKVSKKYVSKELAKEIHAKAAPFVKWLKEAEEESEGSEEEEEGCKLCILSPASTLSLLSSERSEAFLCRRKRFALL